MTVRTDKKVNLSTALLERERYSIGMKRAYKAAKASKYLLQMEGAKVVVVLEKCG